MRRFTFIALLALGACTQPPAQVVDKGDVFFGKDGQQQTAFAAPASPVLESNGYQEKANVESVSSAPLSPVAAASKLAFIWPVDGGHVISHFGGKNDGINIVASEGKPIHAAADGTVIYAGNELKDYGNMIILKHADGYMTAYAHASTVAIAKGATVKQGDVIGLVGKTGAVTQAQLHFGIRSGHQSVDPEQYLPKTFAHL